VLKILGRKFGRKIADSRHHIAACTLHIMQKNRAKYKGKRTKKSRCNRDNESNIFNIPKPNTWLDTKT
jgi:hypothetical protein